MEKCFKYQGEGIISTYGAAAAEKMRAQAAISTIGIMNDFGTFGLLKSSLAAKQGGLNLFKFGYKEATSEAGWKEGDRFLKMFEQGSPKLNWKQNLGFLRKEMGTGNPIFDSYSLVNGNLIPTQGFLNAERNLLQSAGWNYNPSQGAWLPSSL